MRASDGYNGVYLLVDHMTMDAQSLICFMSDAIQIYCNKVYEGIDYPKPMASYIEQLQKDLAYEAGSKAQPLSSSASTSARAKSRALMTRLPSVCTGGR